MEDDLGFADKRERFREKLRYSSRPQWRLLRWAIVYAGGAERLRRIMFTYTLVLGVLFIVLLIILGEQFYVAPVAPAR